MGPSTRERALATISGNAQTFALERAPGTEDLDLAYSQENNTALPKPLSIHAPPDFALGSNDRHAENFKRLEFRRQQKEVRLRRRPESGRPYLQDPKYIQYRIRQRADTGKDGQVIWGDAVEESFQNALVNIRPMGKRKASQHGKPHGRNELISEWIMRETGVFRTRKQVSSHIQVLDGKLKGCPIWDALIKSLDDKLETDRRSFYSNSIQHRVNSQRALQQDSDPFEVSLQPLQPSDHLLDTENDYGERHIVNHVGFHMWVSVPNAMDQALHSYTRIQTPIQTTGPMPLESFQNWRLSFPALQPLVDGPPSFSDCDIILLESSFQLMADFPPRYSKLGISLELDFVNPFDHIKNAISQSSDWLCETYIYRNGTALPDKSPVIDQCHLAGMNRIKPFFESKWWATIFTELTEKKRQADSSEDSARIEAANEYCSRFLKSITIVQVIRGCTSGSTQKSIPMWSQGRRFAILLWKFSQAQGTWEGTTTWRKLIPPPPRITTNSPSAFAAEMALPPLNMDTTIDCSHTNDFFDTGNHFFDQHGGADYPIYDPSMDEELCQDGFMSQHSDTLIQASLAPSFSVGLHGQQAMPELHHYNDSHFDLPTQELTGLPAPRDKPSDDTLNTNKGLSQGLTQPQGALLSAFAQDFEDHLPCRPLSSFDMTTHQILQAQLTTEDSLPCAPFSSPGARPIQTHTRGMSSISFNEEILKSALTASLTVNELGWQQDEHLHTSQPQCLSQPTFSTSPLFVRPALQSHHSFGGFPNSDHHPTALLNVHVDTNARAFAANQAHSALSESEFLSDEAVAALTRAIGIQNQPIRLIPQGQDLLDPTLPANNQSSPLRTGQDMDVSVKEGAS